MIKEFLVLCFRQPTDSSLRINKEPRTKNVLETSMVVFLQSNSLQPIHLYSYILSVIRVLSSTGLALRLRRAPG